MKSLEWNLCSLFADETAFYREVELVEQSLDKIVVAHFNMLDALQLQELLDKKWSLKERANNILVYGSLCYYKDIQNENCIKLKDVAEKLNNRVTAELKVIDRQIVHYDKDAIMALLDKNPGLEIYRLHIDQLYRLQAHLQSEEVNEQIKENSNQINQQLGKYNQLLHNMEYGTILVDGKETTITASNYAKYLASRSREVRKDAYLTVNQSFLTKADAFAEVLNEIDTLRTRNSQLEQYDSVLEKVLYEENIDPKIVTSLITVVHDNLAWMQKYLQLKAQYLEIDTPHLYDFGVPLDDNLKQKYSLEEAIDIIHHALEPLGSQYLAVVDKLLQEGHIDAELDEKKHQSITFSWNEYSFLNFRGSYHDLKNLIHELGHIVNYTLSKQNQPYLYEDSTIFIGETASIVNEILLNRYLSQTAESDELKIFYLSKEIENYFTTVFKQTMYTEFEQALYQLLSQDQPLYSEELNRLYQKTLQTYYGPAICYDEVAKSEWTRLGHLYRWSYYPYKYATGLLIASVVVNALVDDQRLSQEAYIDFLSAGSSQYSLDLLKLLNLDFDQHDILNTGFEVLKQDILAFQKVLEKKK